MSENNLSRFERATVVFAPGLEVDGYQTPSGEFRVGMASASKVVGFAGNWLSRLTTREGKALKALQSLGYTGYHLQGRVLHD